jgi:hypothetical protein
VTARSPATAIADGIVALSSIAQLELSAYLDVREAQGADIDRATVPGPADVLAQAVAFVAERPRDYSLGCLASIARGMGTWAAELTNRQDRVDEDLDAIRAAAPALYDRMGDAALAALFSFGVEFCETLSVDAPDASASPALLRAWAHGVRAALRRQTSELGVTYDDFLAAEPTAGERILPWSENVTARALPLVMAAAVFDLATAIAVSPGTLLALLELLVVELRMSEEAATVDAAIVDLERLEEAVIDGFRRHGLNLAINRRLLWKIELRHGVGQVREVVDTELPSATYAGARVLLAKGWPDGREALHLRARALRAWIAGEIERAQGVQGATLAAHLREQAPLDGVVDAGADKAMQRLEMLDEVRDLEAVLSKREREVVELRLEQLSFEEIAGQLGVKSSTARVLHHKAVEKMKIAAADSAT